MRSLLLAAVALAACTKGGTAPEVDPGLVRVSDDPVLRTDQVGPGAAHFDPDHMTVRMGPSFQAMVTFVLVDAENLSDHDLLVTLGGDLTDATGAVLSHLRPESLRMPSHASRTFALVDDANQPRPAATAARVAVRGAVPPTWTAPMALSDGHAFDDHGKAMVAANLTNGADRPGQVLVLAGFHDAAGHPMERPFDVVELEAGETKVVRFVGPLGSTTGAIWLGDAVY